MGSEVFIVPVLFIGLPWLILHYITRWKTAATLTPNDERLMEDLHALAVRLEDRLTTVERIVSAEDPAWRIAAGSQSTGIEDRTENDNLRRIK